MLKITGDFSIIAKKKRVSFSTDRHSLETGSAFSNLHGGSAKERAIAACCCIPCRPSHSVVLHRQKICSGLNVCPKDVRQTFAHKHSLRCCLKCDQCPAQLINPRVCTMQKCRQQAKLFYSQCNVTYRKEGNRSAYCWVECCTTVASIL